jgi:hypothetical protein
MQRWKEQQEFLLELQSRLHLESTQQAAHQ